MASETKKTTTRRIRRTRSLGKSRKRALDRNGTTKNEEQLFGNVLKPSPS